ncbi:MAG: alpha/beta hydrolase [Myxococcota bacterium]
MKRLASRTLAQLARALAYGAAGMLAAALAGFVWFANDQPELAVWHTAKLDEEFTERSKLQSFEEYLALEERLFVQLEERVYARVEPADRQPINRFHRGSLSDPGRWPRDWNRSSELPASAPRAGVLLLHGMSDSPYSLRSEAERLNAAGAYVVGLRIPGHGTAPVGLTTARWQDMAAAVRLAMRHLRERAGDAPLFLVGYSNGGALSVHYALSALEDGALPAPSGLVLISPEIGIAPVAALAVWQKRIGRLLGLEKLAWSSVLPEYDPFKYQSFAVNAGEQAHRLTAEIQAKLTALGESGALARFPRVLAFQSGVDATVSTAAVIEGLMSRLPAAGHELVLFDLNRRSEVEHLLKHDPRPELRGLLAGRDLPFTLCVITNENEASSHVVLARKPTGRSEASQTPLELAWPDQTFSLAHVALPFSAADPLYGDGSGEPSPGVRLGRLALRGERGVLQVSADEMLRLHWNPFYAYLEQRMVEFVGLADARP